MFDRFKTTISISNTEIYGASKTVRFAKRNVESLEQPREKTSKFSSSERKNNLQERMQVEVRELPIS